MIVLGLFKSTTPNCVKFVSYVAFAFSEYVCINSESSSCESDAIYIFWSLDNCEKSNSASVSSGNSNPVNTFISGFAFCSFTISVSFILLITYSLSSLLYPIIPEPDDATVSEFGLIIPTIDISSAFFTTSFIYSVSSDISCQASPAFL